jgi:hypothetical protein
MICLSKSYGFGLLVQTILEDNGGVAPILEDNGGVAPILEDKGGVAPILEWLYYYIVI